MTDPSDGVHVDSDALEFKRERQRRYQAKYRERCKVRWPLATPRDTSQSRLAVLRLVC